MIVGLKPFLKWPGGKRTLASEIISRIPTPIKHTYHEPFLGGGALFLELARLRLIKKAYLNDTNAELILAWQIVQTNVEELISILESLPTAKDDYLMIRGMDVSSMDRISRAARFIYLNQLCFNGLHRVNSKGQFNVPYGKRKVQIVCNANLLRLVSQTLNALDVRFQVEDFAHACTKARAGDVVYLDPPYIPECNNPKGFVQYSQDGFSLDDHNRVSRAYASMLQRGIHAIVSGSDTRLSRALFDGQHIATLRARRSISADAKARKSVTEILVTKSV